MSAHAPPLRVLSLPEGEPELPVVTDEDARARVPFVAREFDEARRLGLVRYRLSLAERGAALAAEEWRGATEALLRALAPEAPVSERLAVLDRVVRELCAGVDRKAVALVVDKALTETGRPRPAPNGGARG